MTDRLCPIDQSPALPDCARRAWQAHEGELTGFLQARTGHQHDAEDLLQELFLRLFQQGDAFCGIDNARAWLFRVARNLITDRKRKERPQTAVSAQLPDNESAPEPIQLLENCLQKNLAELDPDDRDIIEVCDLQGWTQARYAADRKLGLSATKSRLQRARQKLRASITRNCRVRFSDSGQVCCHAPKA